MGVRHNLLYHRDVEAPLPPGSQTAADSSSERSFYNDQSQTQSRFTVELLTVASPFAFYGFAQTLARKSDVSIRMLVEAHRAASRRIDAGPWAA